MGLPIVSNAQVITFKKYYSTDRRDYGHSIKQTEDNGFIIGGCLDNLITLIKTDSLGNVEWKNSIDTCTIYSNIKVYIPTTDEFLILAEDIQLIKTDRLGNVIWNYTLIDSVNDEGLGIYELIIDKNGKYVMVGTSRSDYYDHNMGVLKVNINGEIEWYKEYGQDTILVGAGIAIDNNNNYVLLGNTLRVLESGTGFQPGDVYFLKVDSFGNQLSQSYLANERRTSAIDIINNGSDNFSILYRSYPDPPEPNSYYHISEITPSGIEGKIFTFNNTLRYPRTISETSDGGFIVGGFVTKLNQFGTIEWETNTVSWEVIQTNDDGYAIIGNRCVQDCDGNWEIYGGPEPDYDVFFLKLDEYGFLYQEINNLKIQPNPFTKTGMITFPNLNNEVHNIRIYDTYGRLARNYEDINDGKQPIYKGELRVGMYILELSNDEQRQYLKFIIN
ncbi:MAG: T9SS type A sorting domain-containing protein [Bacteroidia bacterium]|nr:T9SS type A sorting domain-containing protein [Bacteroidia bacterium]